MFQFNYSFLKFLLIFALLGLTACSLFPSCKFFLRSVSFKVDQEANNRQPITCHIVATYSEDITGILQNMTAKDYFNQSTNLMRKYKGKMEIVFEKDLIPGIDKLNEKVKLLSYYKAVGLFLFAKYKIDGTFAEAIGKSPNIIVNLLSNAMEISTPTPMTFLSFFIDK